MTKQIKKITLKNILITCVLVSIGSLVVYNVKDLLFGTPLVVSTAHDGTTLEENFIPVTGIARHARELLINGRSISLDRKGNFNDGVVLSPGYNIVEIAVKDRFGNNKVKTYHWVVEPIESLARTANNTYQQ
jgi:hypothetical protein